MSARNTWPYHVAQALLLPRGASGAPACCQPPPGSAHRPCMTPRHCSGKWAGWEGVQGSCVRRRCGVFSALGKAARHERRQAIAALIQDHVHARAVRAANLDGVGSQVNSEDSAVRHGCSEGVCTPSSVHGLTGITCHCHWLCRAQGAHAQPAAQLASPHRVLLLQRATEQASPTRLQSSAPPLRASRAF